jgi:membrane protein DedA with SNARE-associated domain
MALLPFILASLVGRAGRFFLVAGLVAAFGPRVEPVLRRHVDTIGWVVVLLAVIAWLVLRN